MSKNYTLKFSQDGDKCIIAHLGNPRFCLEASSFDEAKEKALRAFEYFNRVQINLTTRSKPEVRVNTPRYSTVELYA